MHSEGQIRKAIRPLLELYGELTISEVKQQIDEVLTFDKDDLEQSPTRLNEPKIMQRIGNIVAHQKIDMQVYPEGFIVDKSKQPATFHAISGLGDKKKKITKSEATKRRKSAKKNASARKAHKTDWASVNENRSNIGALGEEYVLETEIEKVTKKNPNEATRVIHLSRDQGDGLGYDIVSINEKGETIYIEVKTTKGPEKTPFFMSRNEKEFFEDNKSNPNVFIYRVYDFDPDSRHGKIKKISSKMLFEKYKFNPTTFEVTKK